MSMITVYRQDQALRGKALSANTLASFLVAQGVRSLPDLSTDKVMNASLLMFLNRQRAVDHWCKTLGRLRKQDGGYVLTESGMDEVLDREANEARAVTGRRKGVNVSPELVRLARYFILTGKAEPPLACRILKGQFQLDIYRGDWKP